MGPEADTGSKEWSDSGFVLQVKPRGLAGSAVTGEEGKERALEGHQGMLPVNCLSGTDGENGT